MAMSLTKLCTHKGQKIQSKLWPAFTSVITKEIEMCTEVKKCFEEIVFEVVFFNTCWANVKS